MRQFAVLEPFGLGGDAGYPRRRRGRPAGPETGSGIPKIASAEPAVAPLGRSDAATGFSAKFGPGDLRHGSQRSKATANEAFNFFRVLKMPKKDPNFASSDTFLASWGNSEAAIGFRAKIGRRIWNSDADGKPAQKTKPLTF